MKRTGHGFALIELLVALAIIAFIITKMMNYYYKKPVMDKDTQKIISGQGIDASSPVSIVDSVKKKLQNIKKEE